MISTSRSMARRGALGAPRFAGVLLAGVAAIALIGCDASDSGTVDPPTPDAWPVGQWIFHGYSDGVDAPIPPMSLQVEAEGTWSHTTDGVADGSGSWQLHGGELQVDSEDIARLPNCTAIRLEGDLVGATYFREDMPSACPDPLPPLTPVERCVVGEFRFGPMLEGLAEIRTAHRTEVLEEGDPSSGGLHFKSASYWYLEGDDLCNEGVDGTTSCQPVDWAMVEAIRATPKDPACIPPGQ